MKLLTKSTYYFLLFSSITVVLGAVIMYFVIRKVVYEQIDNSLVTEMEIIRDQVEQTKSIPDFEASLGHVIEARLLDFPVKPELRINDTIITDATSNEYPYRCLFYKGSLSGTGGFQIRILQTLTEKKELMEGIGLYIFFLFLSFFITSIILNYLISKKLWKPFYITVKRAEEFDIQSDSTVEFPDTNISEFRQLNSVLGQMTKKMRNDYLNLKEYNENSAHEIQTPLAIIRSKLEILMQRKELRKESLNIIKSIDEATTKLFKINQGLLLISKIENFYFQNLKEISLKNLIENILLNYREIMNLRRISVEFTAEDNAVVEMDEMLADILISNLISNAVRYNYEGGFIKCSVYSEYLTISNSGTPLKSDPELLFGRFQRESESSQSAGLGLSIVKKIAENYNMGVTYRCKGSIHELRLDYRTAGNG